ncbi:YhcN/YlaJ family sporulation lipoprotein [Virgibacillus alimentarius]|uniref:YhcN/YlaJ family sporulation lipoprotein n=1 Tax=Virgibacillus alimentarius TaxID=698769 RepID=A0ABS4S796_9BACI|nr:YhcN/YlaJ family sporulation lipoprotein [Virgibacillus alimentarius]MBP2257370.1 YhcN/YlaJ family sporulation lipoprotein [Virgibacillus alimentarius]
MKFKVASVALATTLALVGCGTANDDANRDNGATNNDADNNVEQTRYNDRADNNTRNVRDNDNRNDRVNDAQDRNRDNDRRYNVSKQAADKITDKVDEIDRAYVLTTDNNAYVGAVLNNDDNDNNNNHNDRNNDGVTNNDGINNTGDLNRKNNNTRNNDNENNDNDVTDEVKQQITDVVKSVDNDIDNVYVTTNPDFIDLTNDYANEARNGNPIGGFFDQFGDMIERVFPQGNR